MSTLSSIKNQLFMTGEIDKSALMTLLDAPLQDLTALADQVKNHFCGNTFELCTIVNGKSGSCSEDCAYCAQSAFHHTAAETYPLLASAEILACAQSNFQSGVHRFSVVTSGRSLSDLELEKLSQSFAEITRHCPIALCSSNGLLTLVQLCTLQSAGVTRYHNNLETSRRFFPKICTTHTYDQKIAVLLNAREAGLSLCSGGIIGLGETMEDRIDLAFTLKELQVQSVPLNILAPIKGTPLANQPPLTEAEILRTIAFFRLILPSAAIRLAGGRALLLDHGKQAVNSGINALISGDMLTTSGLRTASDLQMIQDHGLAAGLL